MYIYIHIRGVYTFLFGDGVVYDGGIMQLLGLQRYSHQMDLQYIDAEFTSSDTNQSKNMEVS